MSQEIYNPHDRDEVERFQQFRFAVPAEFFKRIDRSLLTDPSAFDTVANWNGKFPGPCAFGPTNGGKTRAAWSALEKLWIKNRQQFVWFPVRRMVTLLSKADEKGDDEKFFKDHAKFSILFVDDIDKINWAFESHMSALFSFYDWVYRQNKPCISTTNKDPAWWAERMGDAFARRLFEGAHFAVSFAG